MSGHRRRWTAAYPYLPALLQPVPLCMLGFAGCCLLLAACIG